MLDSYRVIGEHAAVVSYCYITTVWACFFSIKVFNVTETVDSRSGFTFRHIFNPFQKYNNVKLSEPALVLNRNWFPIQTTSVRNALCLLYTGACKAIDPESFLIHNFNSWSKLDPGENSIITVHSRIRIPDVILLSKYGKIPRMSVNFSRRNLYRRDGYTCQYCTTRFPYDKLTMDHILPKSKGGRTNWCNCVVACGPCNRRKADRTPKESGMKLLRHPSVPKWSPYLNIDERKRRAVWSKFVKKQTQAS